MQPDEQGKQQERSPWWRWMLGGVAIFVVIVVAIIFLINRAAKDRFDLPVDVYVCGSAIDLATVEPGIAPIGCVMVPNGIQLSMADPDVEAHAYTDGFFGFRKIPAGSSDATLIAEGAIASSTMYMVSIDEDGATTPADLVAGTGADGLPEWTAPLRVSSGLERLSIYIVTSPDSPPSNA
jgi:hypothetical protein